MPHGQRIQKFVVADQRVRSLSFSPDSRLLALGTADRRATLWDWRRATKELEMESSIFCFAWHPDGTSLATADGTVMVPTYGDVTIRETRTGDELDKLPTGVLVTSVAWSPDGERLAATLAAGRVKVWNLRNRSSVELDLHSSGVSSFARYMGSSVFAWSPSGDRLAAGNADGALFVWEVSTWNEFVSSQGHSAPVKSVAWSPDGRRLATGSDDQALKIWDATTGEELLTLHGHTGAVDSIAWAADGRLASGGDDAVRIWEAPGYEGVDEER